MDKFLQHQGCIFIFSQDPYTKLRTNHYIQIQPSFYNSYNLVAFYWYNDNLQKYISKIFEAVSGDEYFQQDLDDLFQNRYIRRLDIKPLITCNNFETIVTSLVNANRYHQLNGYGLVNKVLSLDKNQNITNISNNILNTEADIGLINCYDCYYEPPQHLLPILNQKLKTYIDHWVNKLLYNKNITNTIFDWSLAEFFFRSINNLELDIQELKYYFGKYGMKIPKNFTKGYLQLTKCGQPLPNSLHYDKLLSLGRILQSLSDSDDIDLANVYECYNDLANCWDNIPRCIIGDYEDNSRIIKIRGVKDPEINRILQQEHHISLDGNNLHLLNYDQLTSLLVYLDSVRQSSRSGYVYLEKKILEQLSKI